jgi:hypothetical protein
MVKFELWAWSDAELKLIAARSMLGAIEENLFQEGNKADSEALMGVRILVEGALEHMDFGRVHGEEEDSD